MTTLGEKVTETIVNALGKGVESAGMAQHQDLKAMIAPRLEAYLAHLDKDSVEYKELAHLSSNTSPLDILLMVIGDAVGLIMSILDVGGPYRENIKHGIWGSYPTRYPEAVQIIAANMKGVVTDEDTSTYLRHLGYAEGPRMILQAAMQKPLQPDQAIDLYLRGDINAQKLLAKLAAAGLSVEDQGLAIKLMWRIPGVSDLIRMAVREAFTPEIAEKFGQYADFPPAFAEWALKQGLTTEWAQRYWAAHWELPSVNQGFEMLHRGVINQTDMELLLRAQDVMPFWRDKLTSIAYNPLTRVDVRRMYQLGIIDEAAVLKAYRDLGYNKENALRLTEFCKRYYGVEDDTEQVADREYTKSEILSGYRNGTLTGDQALGSLQDMGYSPDQAGFYLAQEDLKATQTLKAAYLARYQALYVAGILSADDVTTNLKALGIGDDEIKQNLAVWYLQRISQVQRPTKAELIRWLKAGIISQAIWESEMRLQGFSDRYISWYLAEISSQPAIAQQTEEVA